jgi:hypothetical protein
MSDQKPNKISVNSGAFHEVLVRGKLILHLMADRRVNFFLKAIPVASIIYILNPLDIPGPFDDLAIFSLGLYAFVELCPPTVVQEHLDNLHGITPDISAQTGTPEDNIIDGEFRETQSSSDDEKS